PWLVPSATTVSTTATAARSTASTSATASATTATRTTTTPSATITERRTITRSTLRRRGRCCSITIEVGLVVGEISTAFESQGRCSSWCAETFSATLAAVLFRSWLAAFWQRRSTHLRAL